MSLSFALRRAPSALPLHRTSAATAVLLAILAHAPVASAQWTVTGSFVCGPTCLEDWNLDEADGEIYAFKVPIDDLDAEPDLALYQHRFLGTRLGIDDTDVTWAAYQVTEGWREPVVPDEEAVFVLALGRGSLTFDSAEIEVLAPDVEFTLLGLSRQQAACAFPGLRGPRVLAEATGSAVTWRPIQELDASASGMGACADAGAWRRGFVLGYNVYRLDYPSPVGDSLADFRLNGWLGFADLATLDFTVADPDGAGGSDLDPADALTLVNPDGVPDSGDELLTWLDPTPGSFQYRVQPVVRGDPAFFDGGLTSSELAPAVRTDLDGDGFPEAVDIAPDGSPEFLDPSGRGLGLTHGGEIFSSLEPGTPANEPGEPLCNDLDDTAMESNCGDGLDDDDDGLIDCADPDCDDDPGCDGPSTLSCGISWSGFTSCGEGTLVGSGFLGVRPYAFQWSSEPDCDVEFLPSDQVADPDLITGSCPPGCEATLTVTDQAGASCSVSVVLLPMRRFEPELSAPDSVVVECPGPPDGAPDGRLSWLASASATNFCDDAEVLVDSSLVPGCGGSRRWEVSFTAVDPCGNASEPVERTYEVVDTTAPELSPPEDVEVACEDADVASWLAGASAGDSCSTAEVHSRLLERHETCAGDWREIHELWASDDCGNESPRVVRTYHALDRRPPLLSAPADLDVECPAPATGPGSVADWLAEATATDACGGASVEWRLVGREPGCGSGFTETHEIWAVDDCGLESPRVERRYRVLDRRPPVLVAPGDLEVECPAPADGPSSLEGWLASATATDACGSATVRSRLLGREEGCGGTWTEHHELWAVDDCGLESARVTRSYAVVDTTPPRFTETAPVFDHVLWPPDHSWASFEVVEELSAVDECGEVRIEAEGCESSQPADARDGDGETAVDCLLAVDGSAFAVRAERQGSCGPESERRYRIAFVARDACGNEARTTGWVRVPHSAPEAGRDGRGRRLRRAEDLPYPTRHATSYGEPCDEAAAPPPPRRRSR